MNIIAHRGYWKKPYEKNTKVAFKRAFDLGYGVETDIRDSKGELVISHNIPNQDSMPLKEFLLIYKRCNRDLPLVLNIKSDGLHDSVKLMVNRFNIRNYFVFDMSVPDTIGYCLRGIKVFSRVSELEFSDRLNLMANGIWLDQFYSNWYTRKDLINLVEKYNNICIVSPELHKREYIGCWKMILRLPVNIKQNLMLCTDFPEEAKEYFLNEK